MDAMRATLYKNCNVKILVLDAESKNDKTKFWIRIRKNEFGSTIHCMKVTFIWSKNSAIVQDLCIPVHLWQLCVGVCYRSPVSPTRRLPLPRPTRLAAQLSRIFSLGKFAKF
jgi:hypothetical protein